MDRRENLFKRYLIKIMGTRWDVQSHEDQMSEGIPDLSFGANQVGGWIELKQIPSLPKKQSTLIKPAHYTPNQVNWLKRRGKKSGHCFVFVKVGDNDYYLFDWSDSRNIKNGVTYDWYQIACLRHYHKSIDPDDLLNILTSDC